MSNVPAPLAQVRDGLLRVVFRLVIPLFKVFMPESVMAPLRDVLLSGWIGEGPKVREFEHALAPWFGTPNILAVNSGTSALHLALRLAGVGPGSEVISTPMTCIATNVPVVALAWIPTERGSANAPPGNPAGYGQLPGQEISPRLY